MYSNVCIDPVTYRKDTGKGSAVDTTLGKQLRINRYHFSSEIIASAFSSFVVPKQSVLKVSYSRILHTKCMYSFTILYFTFQNLLESTLYRLQASGILTKLKDDALNSPRPIPLPKLRINQPLSLAQMAPAMFIMITGLALAMVAFIGEKCGKFVMKRV
jgi:hypothetical protein